MSESLAGYFVTLARYHSWATARLLDAISPIGDEDYRRAAGLFFDSIHGTLNHLLVAEGLWYERFANARSPTVALDTELSADREDVAAMLRESVARWETLVISIPLSRYAGKIDYRTMRGANVSLPFAETLGHVFNHGTHHRGQITAAISRCGAMTPELDLVYMLQQEQQA